METNKNHLPESQEYEMPKDIVVSKDTKPDPSFTGKQWYKKKRTRKLSKQSRRRNRK